MFFEVSNQCRGMSMTAGVTELAGTEPTDGPRPSLDRVLNPRSIAVVGVSESSPYAAGPQRSLESGAEFFFDHPKVDSVFGHKTYPDLRALGRPVDAVYSAVGAELTVDVVEQAAEI